MMRHFEDGDSPSALHDKYEKYKYEATITGPIRHRGYFIRTCGESLSDKVLFKFYAYKQGLLEQYFNPLNSDA